MASVGGNEPVNLLSCDGGGIRGVSELVILDAVMKRIQELKELEDVPRPCDYFHLIGGTSTGGLLAIMLGRLEMSTEEALAAYDDFARDIFSHKRHFWTRFVEQYKAESLEQTVRQLVRDKGVGVLMRNQKSTVDTGHAFVCTMPEQKHKEMVRFRTYEISSDKYPHLLIYQAARATTAATTFFRPMPIHDDEGTKENFIDAALGTNNPATICLEEARELFGSERELNCVVSLGTGTRQKELDKYGRRGPLSQIKYLVSSVMLMKELSTDSEKVHKALEKQFDDYGKSYFRFNVDGGAQDISLADWKKMDELKERTKKYLEIAEVKKSINELVDAILQPNHGLRIGNVLRIDKNTTIPKQPRQTQRGTSSRIFTGRENLLKRLGQHFQPREPGNTSRREFQIHGMGGVGKTQIALKFTERNAQSFRHILWIDATDTVTIYQSFQKIALGILDEMDEKKSVQIVLHWLEDTDEDWLLVFDNAPDSGLSQYLPSGDQGNILYTTRHPYLKPRLRPDWVMSVDVMELQDATELLLRSAELPAYNRANWELAKLIVRELGYLPLAIDQAGAYINRAPCPLEQYLDVFRKQKEELLKNPKFEGGDALRDIAVYATFDVSLRAIKACAGKKAGMRRVEDAQAALKLLNMICFYHNEGHLHKIFEHAALERFKTDRDKYYPLRAGHVRLDEFVKTAQSKITPNTPDGQEWLAYHWLLGAQFLHEYSLIKFDNSICYVNMHVLVHNWARDCMSNKERSDWGLAARCALMDSLHLHNDVRNIIHRREMLPHLEACQRYADFDHPDLGLESEYKGLMGKLFLQNGRLEEARKAYEKAFDYRKLEFGLMHAGTCSALSQLAKIHQNQGNYAQAEELRAEVIDRRRLLHWETKWEVSQQNQPNRGKREQFHQPDFYSEELLEDYLLRGDTLALIEIYLERHQLRAAEVQLSRILKWKQIKYGADSGEAREAQIRLIKVQKFQQMGYLEDVPEGLTIEQAQNRFDLATAGRDSLDPVVIIAKERLARVLIEHKIYIPATELLESAYISRGLLYGKNSIECAHALYKYAGLLKQQNRVYEAQDHYEDALRKYNDILGSRHSKTLECTYAIAECYALRARYAEAAACAAASYDGQRDVLGPDHLATRSSAHFLRQWSHWDEMLPDWLKVQYKNQAAKATKTALGDHAPQWIREWDFVDTDKIQQAHLVLGDLQWPKYTVVTVDGYKFGQITLDGTATKTDTVPMSFEEAEDIIKRVEKVLKCD
ncbi:hypothetical protein BD289DRAFT_91836 [Coniella lustricola]|uniref:PNPLA domain-containing protein n=1 Tax=Coniella lustricola TaxID=2025994 RepID=A0A2T3AH43_9PEZI|nr:hypothetical protein BD289DRAFT_91836 [Coniella lustricola]